MLGTPIWMRCPHCEDRTEVMYVGNTNGGSSQLFSCQECGKSFYRGPIQHMEIEKEFFKPASRHPLGKVA